MQERIILSLAGDFSGRGPIDADDKRLRFDFVTDDSDEAIRIDDLEKQKSTGESNPLEILNEAVNADEFE